jgi:hypothetical protein
VCESGKTRPANGGLDLLLQREIWDKIQTETEKCSQLMVRERIYNVVLKPPYRQTDRPYQQLSKVCSLEVLQRLVKGDERGGTGLLTDHWIHTGQ